MKKTLTTIAIICSLTAFGQNSQEHIQNGIAKHKQQDLKGAIKDYDKAIKEYIMHSLRHSFAYHLQKHF